MNPWSAISIARPWGGAALAAAALVFTAGIARGESEELTVQVLSIGDGDTITVRRSQQRFTVRLACIDAPEMAQSPHGAAARQALQARVRLGQTVRIRPQTTDRFGRTVAEVIAGVNVNLALVESGMVFVYRQYLGGCDAQAYLGAETRASRQRLGVWHSAAGITRPWDFRRNRSTARPAAPGGGAPARRRYRCKELSFQQAQLLLRQGHRYLDRNGDGQACDSRG